MLLGKASSYSHIRMRRRRAATNSKLGEVIALAVARAVRLRPRPSTDIIPSRDTKRPNSPSASLSLSVSNQEKEDDPGKKFPVGINSQ